MKKFLLGTIAAIAALAAGSASAADMSKPMYKAAPPPAPVASWTGFYVGAGYGYGMWTADTIVAPAVGLPPTAAVTNGGKGWLGDVVAGYDYQFNAGSFGNMVAGVFGNYDFGSIKGQFESGTAFAPVSTLGGTEKETSSWAVGGRIGFLVAPTLLTYWNGGYTQAHFDGVNFGNLGVAGPLVAPLTTPSNTYHGWFLGGGLEYRVTFLPIQGLFFNTEYRYSDYHSASLPVTGALANFGSAANLNVHPYVQTVTSGLVYKFNWMQ
jgi:outer membrane immunogenic protein